MLASWKLERGTTLGSLEQLLASRSLVGALQTMWSLRVLNIMGAVLVALAIISPLGGQSSLQMLRMEDIPTVSQPHVAYLNTGKESYSEFFSGTYYHFALATMNTMYSSSITAPASVKNSTVDLWGNVKIPYLSRLGSPVEQDGWQNATLEADFRKYSSLIGIPVSGLSASANMSFTMETSYLDLDCYRVTDEGGQNTQVKNISSYLNASSSGEYWGTEAGSTFIIAMDGLRERSYRSAWNIWEESANKTNLTYPRRTLLFRSRAVLNDVGTRLTDAYCRISTVYVEAAVRCTGLLCQVTRMRPSQQPHPHQHLVPFEFSFFFSVFGGEFPLACGKPPHQTSSLTEFYLDNPTNTLYNTYRTMVGLYKLSREDMSIRLGQTINSYYLSSLSPWSITGITDYAGGSQATPGRRAPNITTAALMSVNAATCVCQWGWWVVFVLACIAMLVTASAGTALRQGCRGPDILGYVSPMARDSRYVKVPPGGSTLDGADCGRFLKEVKVQLRDIQRENGTGRLALASLEGKPSLLMVDRIYK